MSAKCKIGLQMETLGGEIGNASQLKLGTELDMGASCNPQQRIIAGSKKKKGTID